MFLKIKMSKSACPLLKFPETYKPDIIDLCVNTKERNYWLPCLDRMVKKFVNKVKELNPGDPKATEKAQFCYQQFHELVEQLAIDPSLLKPLTVRTLLDINEDNLRANNFIDPFQYQKDKENILALKEFKNRLNQLDEIDVFDERWEEIIRGVLAGNIFDWGAKAVTDIMENSFKFGFSEALNLIELRPWFIDNLDLWTKKLKEQSYKSCVIFLDNAGADFVLGILPFARELLSQGTKVILTANSSPSLNDMTISELNLYCCKASDYCNILKESIASGKLITVENGQKGPCLDLLNLSCELCELMKTVDLVIIEGMGRAVHTNLYAKFTVDCFKLAVLKNEWLAHYLGAKQFSVICDFTIATNQ